MTVGNCFWPAQWYILKPLACASWALMIDNKVFFCKNCLESSYPKKYEHPLTSLFFTIASNFPVSLSTGSAHIRSQKRPVFGIYLNLSIFFISSRDLISGDIPPWMHRNLLFTRAESGRLSKSSITFSYTSWSYLSKPKHEENGTLLSKVEESG